MKTKLEEKMKRIYYIFIVCIMSAFMLSCGKKQDVNIPDKQEEKVQQEEKNDEEIFGMAVLSYRRLCNMFRFSVPDKRERRYGTKAFRANRL